MKMLTWLCTVNWLLNPPFFLLLILLPTSAIADLDVVGVLVVLQEFPVPPVELLVHLDEGGRVAQGQGGQEQDGRPRYKAPHGPRPEFGTRGALNCRFKNLPQHHVITTLSRMGFPQRQLPWPQGGEWRLWMVALRPAGWTAQAAGSIDFRSSCLSGAVPRVHA